jgi:hypothetical protein
MGKIKKSAPVKIIAGLIASEERLFDKVSAILSKRLGAIDNESKPCSFNYTNYYTREMGNGLKRKFLSFERLVQPDGIEKVKIFTNHIEKRLSRHGKRSVNIDPGYLSDSKLVLLTTKDYCHRLYLNKGIYAEVTLYFREGEFRPWEWSYPDYKTSAYKDFFGRVRQCYCEQLRLK